MAYDEQLAVRVQTALGNRRVRHEETAMMGGLCFMVEDKMNLLKKGGCTERRKRA